MQNTARQGGALIAVSILGSVLNTALPAGRLPVAFGIIGADAAAGIAAAVIALRAPVAAADGPHPALLLEREPPRRPST